MYKVIVKGWIEKNGEFLLAKRGETEKHHSGVWSLPGGNIEEDTEENVIENTLKREIKEETGVEIDEKMELIHTNSFIKTSDNSRVINLTFLTHWKSGVAKPLEDTSEIKWLTIKELQSLSNPPDFLIKEIIQLKNHLQRN